MGLREKLNGNPAATAVLMIVIIAVALWFGVRSVIPHSPVIALRAFFSVDEGKTWFADDVKKMPPFKTAEGKEAVQAVVVSCKGGKDPFVMFVWRYTPEAREKLTEAEAAGDPAKLGSVTTGLAMSKEMKKPGQSAWTKMTDFRNSSQVTAMVCPPGEEDLIVIDP